MAEPKPQGSPRHWWQTLPGAISAITALVTAVTGLIVALHQLGVGFGSGSKSPPAADVSSDTAQGGTTQGNGDGGGAAAAAYRVSFPKGTRAVPYDILGARAEERNPGELALRFTIRMTNDGQYDANFWDRSFRLHVGGSARAPIDFLDEVVAAGTSKDGTVTFAVPSSARQVTLLIGDPGTAVVRLPVALTPR